MAENNTRKRLRIHGATTRTLALPGRWPALTAFDPTQTWSWFAENARREVEQRRLFPWTAVCFGIGILSYFEADGRPGLVAPVVAAGLTAGLLVRFRNHPIGGPALVGLLAALAGFAACVIRERSIEPGSIGRIAITPLTGFVEGVEDRPKGARVLIRVVTAAGLRDGERPARVRVTVRDAGGLRAGDFVSGTARLLPPPQPSWPGGYDFARDAYFKGIGAVGSVVGRVRVIEPPAPPGWRPALAAAVDRARNDLTQRIAGSIGEPAGGVAAALVTGKRGLIEEATNGVLQAAGIYHIVSISGLHMVLAAGTFFWLTRAILAWFPAAALLLPVKKIAAGAAMAGAVAYCVFSGSEVATERSLVMTLVMFGAVLVDRPALSIRNCAIAALVVLAREPETLLGPSFQMSFGAVVALIAVAPLLNVRSRDGRVLTLLDRAVAAATRSLIGLIGMTIVATAATAPFSAHHFQTFNPFGLVGNALALPLVSLVVMPSALLGVLAYPFGVDQPVWQVMGYAVGKVLEVSSWIQGFDGSTVAVPALGPGALLLLSATLLITTLMVSSLRWVALIPAGAGLVMAAAPVRYDLFVDREGAGAAVRGRDGRLVVVGRPSGFVVEQWLRADGDRRTSDDGSVRDGARCDRVGCVVRLVNGSSVSLVLDPAGFEEDCRRATVIVTRLPAPGGCGAPLVIDREVLQAKGAMAVRWKNAGFDVAATRSTGEPRPWAARDAGPNRPAGERLSPRDRVEKRPEPGRTMPPVPDLDDPDEISSAAPG
jgi:competence protein ComEC